MLEEAQARNSERIAKLNGRILCSSIDPSREARKWVDLHSEISEDCETIFVLGLGCGYHIVEPDYPLFPDRDMESRQHATNYRYIWGVFCIPSTNKWHLGA